MLAVVVSIQYSYTIIVTLHTQCIIELMLIQLLPDINFTKSPVPRARRAIAKCGR